MAVVVSLLAVWLAASETEAESLQSLRGVNPQFLKYYQPVTLPDYDGEFFACDPLGAATEFIPYHSLNDDFCDCSNGADEPGTSACSFFEQAAFYCPNKGSIPKLVFASRVGDGICDCCDGSDEWQHLSKSCPNVCGEEGRDLRAKREARIVEIEQGIVMRNQEMEKAKAQIAEWKAQMIASDEAMPTLEAAQTATKEALDALEAAAQETTPSPDSDGDVMAGEDENVSEYAKWMEKEHEDEKKTELQVAKEAYEKASNEVSEGRKKIESLKSKVNLDFGPDHAFFSLVDQCIELEVDHYKYKLCFFDSIEQHEGYSSVKLGSFSGWSSGSSSSESESTEHAVMLYTNGQWCPGGPARTARVNLKCGLQTRLVSVHEPSRCSYEATVITPGGCKEKDLANIRDAMQTPNVNRQEADGLPLGGVFGDTVLQHMHTSKNILQPHEDPHHRIDEL